MTRKRRPPKTHYSLVDELLASDSAPMPAHTRRHQLTRMAERTKDAVHMLGNAVCPPVARDVINAIKEAA